MTDRDYGRLEALTETVLDCARVLRENSYLNVCWWKYQKWNQNELNQEMQCLSAHLGEMKESYRAFRRAFDAYYGFLEHLSHEGEMPDD